MRFDPRIWLTTFGIAASALAAPPAAAEMTPLLRTPSPFDPSGQRREQQRERERGRVDERANQRERGPFHPLAGTSDYGTAVNRFGNDRGDHIHAGQDVFAPAGTPLVAVTDGVIVQAGSDGGQGNYVYLYDPRRDRTYIYMHMIAPAEVSAGEQVRAGQPVGAVGCTGSCWGDHLHFEIRAGRGIGGEASDPLAELQSWDRVPS